MIEQELRRLAEMRHLELDPGDERGWAGWLLEELEAAAWLEDLTGSALSDNARHLLELVGPQVDPNEGLSGLLNQLEPVGGDLAVQETGGIRLMSMAKSKGLTVDTAIVLGVEEGIVPFPRGDQDEERPLASDPHRRARRCRATTGASSSIA